jgi:hypothetical protein
MFLVLSIVARPFTGSVENLRSAQLAASKFLGIIIKELRSRMEPPLVTLSMSHSIEF